MRFLMKTQQLERMMDSSLVKDLSGTIRKWIHGFAVDPGRTRTPQFERWPTELLHRKIEANGCTGNDAKQFIEELTSALIPKGYFMSIAYIVIALDKHMTKGLRPNHAVDHPLH